MSNKTFSAFDFVWCLVADTQVQRSCHCCVKVKAATARKLKMKGTLKAFLETAKEQLTGRRRSRLWTAYTRSGKVVVIDGDRVIKVIDTHKRKGAYAG